MQVCSSPSPAAAAAARVGGATQWPLEEAAFFAANCDPHWDFIQWQNSSVQNAVRQRRQMPILLAFSTPSISLSPGKTCAVPTVNQRCPFPAEPFPQTRAFATSLLYTFLKGIHTQQCQVRLARLGVWCLPGSNGPALLDT